MKKKDITYLILAVVILLVAAYLAYTQLLGNKTNAASSGTTVEVIGTIPSSFNSDAQKLLLDTTQSVDYSVPSGLTTGLGNSAVFGQ